MMNIRRVNDFYTFTSKYQKIQNKNIDFYNLNYDEKIDVLYDILQEQNQKLAALYNNQIAINNFNKHAFDAIIAASAKNSNAADIAYKNIDYQYNRCENKVNLVG